ncbi:hypothetical protein GCM10014715_10250 [Streptomyces spiralis]|uniref:ABC transporter n=1 Tax=Streptomyces spiralis TaxID=66376 RepID=A0A919DM51_9ACTN|nr:hypothetical protein GCM10014715_10250 [Streptomyces spiralis]
MIEARGLTKRYGRTVAVDALDFDVRPGAVTGFLGPNGLLAAGSVGVCYLLKDRVASVAEFTDALSRVAAGGTALDPEVVTQLAGGGRRIDYLGA